MTIEVQQVGAFPARRWDVVWNEEGQAPIFVGYHGSQLEAETQADALLTIISRVRAWTVAQHINRETVLI